MNMEGEDFTMDDRKDHYALDLSHEITEMIVDPHGHPWANPEVCDPCGYLCLPLVEPGPAVDAPPFALYWRAFFGGTAPDGESQYLCSDTEIAGNLKYDFFVAAVISPDWYGTGCPPPMRACNFGPDARVGVTEIQFYDPAGYGEVYSVDTVGNLALQTTQPQWGTTFSKIVAGWGPYPTWPLSPLDRPAPGGPPPNPADGRTWVQWDTLMYDPVHCSGVCNQIGHRGDMNQRQVYTDWRSTWSLIVPGHFSGSEYSDLLFYDPSAGSCRSITLTRTGSLTMPIKTTLASGRPGPSLPRYRMRRRSGDTRQRVSPESDIPS